MRKPIQQLPTHIASLIAAGEIIKRPEDIIRELIDNSIDASATQIDINITQGGLEKIQITDNGIGIPSDELQIALMHHATSKIRKIEDIEQLQTLGFRGEALASITAVARIELTSRISSDIHGFTITSKPNQPISAPNPIAHPIGTTIVITELFHEIPARRRFLRTASTEFARIHHWIKHLSLSHPSIGFSLTHNKKSILKYTPSEKSHNTRLASLYSPDFVKSAIFFEKKERSFQLTGWISPPHFSRGQPDWQCLYVNDRLIKDKSISHAIKKAYQDVLYRDRHPVVVLFLKLDPSEVDVNVHPTKAEVRFHQPQQIYHFVYKCIIDTLTQHTGWVAQTHPIDHLKTLNTPEEKAHNDFYNPPQFEEKPSSTRFESFDKADAEIKPLTDTPPLAPIPTNFQASLKETVAQQTHLEEDAHTNEPLGYALAQLHSTYILAQNNKGLIIVDAHAAHERILYEALKASYDAEKKRTQRLLVPLVISLTPEEVILFEAHTSLFKSMGFELVISDAQTLTIQTVPHILSSLSYELLIRDMLSDLKEHSLSIRLEEKRNQLLSTVACRSATHANRTMSLYEMNQLLRDMEKTPHSGQCNHGRPTWRQITLSELNSWFLRGR